MANPTSLLLEELPTSTCAHLSLRRTRDNTTDTRLHLQASIIAEDPPVLGHMDSSRRDLLAHTDILRNRSTVKALHRLDRREGTGAVVRHRRNRADILVLDTALVDNNTRQGPTDSPHLARADGVAIRHGTELHCVR